MKVKCVLRLKEIQFGSEIVKTLSSNGVLKLREQSSLLFSPSPFHAKLALFIVSHS